MCNPAGVELSSWSEMCNPAGAELSNWTEKHNPAGVSCSLKNNPEPGFLRKD
jgi:hypothetical protein